GPGGGGRHQQEHPDQEQDQVQLGAADGPDEGDAPEGVGPEPGADRQDDGGERLAGELGRLGQPKAALVADLEVVVDAADDAEQDHGDHDQDAGRGEGDPGAAEQVDGQVADHRPEDHHRPAHGRGAALGLVGVGQVDLDELAQPAPPEGPDGQGGPHQPEGQGDGGRDEDADQLGVPRREQGVGDAVEGDDPAGLDQDHVGRAEDRDEQVEGGVGVGAGLGP